MALPIESGRRSTSRGVEVGGAKGLGQPVHQVRLAVAGRSPRSRSSVALGMRPPVLAKYRRLSAASSGHFCSASWIHSGGTQVSPVTRCLAHRRTTSPGKQIVHEHDVRADRKRRRELAEAGVEAERQDRQDAIVLVVLEILADALRPDDQVAMRNHDALRLAGAPRRVEDRRHVDVDDVRIGEASRRRWMSSQSAAANDDAE